MQVSSSWGKCYVILAAKEITYSIIESIAYFQRVVWLNVLWVLFGIYAEH